MPLPPTAKKLLPLLLIVSAALIVIGDQAPFKPIAHSPAKHETSSGSPKLSGEKIRDHGSESDHQDPEKNKRMGIFHYNEGNKSFLSGNLEEAVKNYKKALHHDKDFKDVRIILSTAYLKEKQYKIFLCDDFSSANDILQYFLFDLIKPWSLAPKYNY